MFVKETPATKKKKVQCLNLNLKYSSAIFGSLFKKWFEKVKKKNVTVSIIDTAFINIYHSL